MIKEIARIKSRHHHRVRQISLRQNHICKRTTVSARNDDFTFYPLPARQHRQRTRPLALSQAHLYYGARNYNKH